MKRAEPRVGTPCDLAGRAGDTCQGQWQDGRELSPASIMVGSEASQGEVTRSQRTLKGELAAENGSSSFRDHLQPLGAGVSAFRGCNRLVPVVPDTTSRLPGPHVAPSCGPHFSQWHKSDQALPTCPLLWFPHTEDPPNIHGAGPRPGVLLPCLPPSGPARFRSAAIWPRKLERRLRGALTHAHTHTAFHVQLR